MKRLLWIYSLLILLLASCSSASAPLPTNTPFDTLTPSSTPKPTETPIPTITPTRTPLPTATPRPELTADVVGLPWDTNSIATDIPAVTYKPCYVNTATRWHAGDGFIWRLKSGQIIDVVSPVDGKVVYVIEDWVWKNQSSGGNIIVETPYVLNGETVYYHLRHSSTFDDDIQEGITLSKGQHIGTLRWDGPKDPGGYSLLDFMLLSGDLQINTPEDEWERYFDTAPFHLDDLELIPHSVSQGCEGNPK